MLEGEMWMGSWQMRGDKLDAFLREYGLSLAEGRMRNAKYRVKTTRIAGGLTWPCKGLLLAAPQGAAFSSFKPGASIT
jgi:hypothetical protein